MVSTRAHGEATVLHGPAETIVKRQPSGVILSRCLQTDGHSTPPTMRKSRSTAFPSTCRAC
jgi:hypothetical protein